MPNQPPCYFLKVIYTYLFSEFNSDYIVLFYNINEEDFLKPCELSDCCFKLFLLNKIQDLY